MAESTDNEKPKPKRKPKKTNPKGEKKKKTEAQEKEKEKEKPKAQEKIKEKPETKAKTKPKAKKAKPKTMKKFIISGSFVMGDTLQKFQKEVEALGERRAREKIYQDLGSKHHVKRSRVLINDVEEAK